MKPVFLKIMLGLLFAAACALPAAAEDTRRILEAADRARGAHQDGFEVTTTVEAFTGGRRNREVFFVRGKGSSLLAETREPASRRGNLLLIHEARAWFLRPALSRPVPLSRRQRMMGHADYGDITPTDYANHYKVRERGVELLDGNPCHVFSLRASHPDALYEQLKLWICKEQEVVLRADYFAVSGKKLKTARLSYEEAAEAPEGSRQPLCTRIRMTDSLRDGEEYTLILFSAHRQAPLPDHLFHLNRLGR